MKILLKQIYKDEINIIIIKLITIRKSNTKINNKFILVMFTWKRYNKKLNA